MFRRIDQLPDDLILPTAEKVLAAATPDEKKKLFESPASDRTAVSAPAYQGNGLTDVHYGLMKLMLSHGADPSFAHRKRSATRCIGREWATTWAPLHC